MKLIALTVATMKHFLRDPRSILLLVVCPILLIGVVFVSFNPDGLRSIPAGFVVDTPEFGFDAYGSYFSYFDVIWYGQVEECIEDAKKGWVYLCVHVQQYEQLSFVIHFDNTREPVIWELIDRLDRSFTLIKQQQSMALADTFISGVHRRQGELDTYIERLRTTQFQILDYAEGVGDAEQQVVDGRTRLSSTLDGMDQDIAEARSELTATQQTKDRAYQDANDALADAQAYTYIDMTGYPVEAAQQMANVRTEILNARDVLYDMSQNIDIRLNHIRLKLDAYQQSSAEGRSDIQRLREAQTLLQRTKQELIIAHGNIDTTLTELQELQGELDVIGAVDPEGLVHPYSLQNQPLFQPYYDEEQLSTIIREGDATVEEQIVKGLNLISLQTLFPVILILIIMFLALIVGSFSTLLHFNSPSFQRIKTIPKLFLREMTALYTSSILLLVLPIATLLFVGHVLFQIPILEHLPSVMLVLLLTLSIFVVAGMLIASAIRNEGITLVFVTFLFVFLTFFSGFLFPLERMSDVPARFATVFPAKVTLDAFNRMVFYGEPVQTVLQSIIGLGFWLIALTISLFSMERFHRRVRRPFSQSKT